MHFKFIVKIHFAYDIFIYFWNIYINLNIYKINKYDSKISMMNLKYEKKYFNLKN